MSDERKNLEIWPWIVALLIGLPVLYVASFGPACWIYGRTESHRLPSVFRPLNRAFDRDSPIRKPMLWFARIGIGPNGSIALPESEANWLWIISSDGLDVWYVGGGNTF